MKNFQTFRARLNRQIFSAARITIHCPIMAKHNQALVIAAKARAYAANNPQPTAIYILG